LANTTLSWITQSRVTPRRELREASRVTLSQQLT
jgi:hypothetical protein